MHVCKIHVKAVPRLPRPIPGWKCSLNHVLWWTVGVNWSLETLEAVGTQDEQGRCWQSVGQVECQGCHGSKCIWGSVERSGRYNATRWTQELTHATQWIGCKLRRWIPRPHWNPVGIQDTLCALHQWLHHPDVAWVEVAVHERSGCHLQNEEYISTWFDG